MMPKLFYKVEVEENSTLLFSEHKEANSWTRNAWNFFTSAFTGARCSTQVFGSGYLTFKNIGGDVYTTSDYVDWSGRRVEYPYLDYCYGYSAGGGLLMGIVVGSSNANLGFNAYKLNSIISHGTSSGRLLYGECRLYGWNWYSENREFEIIWRRQFLNQSGAGVNFGEFGIYAYAGAFYTCLFCRETLDSIIVIPNGASLRITYYIYFKIP